MDLELIQKDIEELKRDGFSVTRFVKVCSDIEKNIAQAQALSSVVRDGSIYQHVKSLQDYGYLMFLLKSMEEEGKELAKAAEAAVKGTDEKMGQDGHSQRFAELLRAQGLSKMSIDDVGTFFIAQKSQAFPPSKEREPEKYASFKEWCKQYDLTTETYKWSSLQSVCEGLGDKVPDFIKVQKREEVRIRRA